MKEKDIVFALHAKCPCGALLAYKRGDDCWDCSDILLEKAVPLGQEGSVQHTDRLPFSFWKVR